MKTIFISCMAVLFCLASYAQINDPVRNPRVAEKNDYRQTIPVFSGQAEPDSPGFDSTWASRLQNMLDAVIPATYSKGASVAVYTPEEGLWTGVSGISFPGIQITPEMRFGIGSNTKLFIAVALLKLQEQGKLTLDDHLYQWLPSIPHVDSSATIRQLLTHESGIWDFWNDQPSVFDQIWNDTSRFWTTGEVLATLGPAHFSPGNGWSYSNTNYMLAALIMEAATGKTWVENLHELIFDPLSLDSTFVGAYEPPNGPVAAEWDAFFNHVIYDSPMTAEYSQVHAAGAILSTASEMVQWYYALLNGMVISNASLEELLAFDPLSLYGLGIWAGVKETLTYSHSGGMMGYTSLVVYDVPRKAVICFLFNDQYAWEERINPMMYLFFNAYPKRPDDAGIISIPAPWEHYCENEISPEISLKNFGSMPLTSVTISYSLDEAASSAFEWTGMLDPGDTLAVMLPSMTTTEGFHVFKCYTSLPNGQPEGYTFYDTLESNFFVDLSTPAITGIFEGFDGNGFPGEGWTLNSASVLQWGETGLARLDGTGSAVVNNYEWSGTLGQYFDLQLPLINVSSLANTDLSFDYAYAAYPGRYGDSLQVSVSADCGQTWQTLFYKGGNTLVTAGYLNDLFYPKLPDQWDHVSLSLSGFEGDILIRFRARNGLSNNLFIDNLAVGWVGVEESEAGSRQPAVSCYPNPATGISHFAFRISQDQWVTLKIYNAQGQEVAVLLDEALPSGEHTVDWDAGTLPAGVYYYQLRAKGVGQVGAGKIVKY